MAKTISDTTALLPYVIAGNVREELERFLNTEFDIETSEDYLVNRAETVYANNGLWAKKIRSGNKGRDLLYAFMRHWLCGWVRTNRPELFNRIPQNYLVGGDLPRVKGDL